MPFSDMGQRSRRSKATSATPDAPTSSVYENFIGTGFFSYARVPLLAGRDFTDADTDDRPKVAIVNSEFLDAATDSVDAAIGKRVGIPQGPGDDELDYGDRGLDRRYRILRRQEGAGAADTVAAPPGRLQRGLSAIGFMTYYVRLRTDRRTMRMALVRKVVAGLDTTCRS